MKMQSTENSQDNLQEVKVGEFTQTHFKAGEINIDWYWANTD